VCGRNQYIVVNSVNGPILMGQQRVRRSTRRALNSPEISSVKSDGDLSSHEICMMLSKENSRVWLERAEGGRRTK